MTTELELPRVAHIVAELDEYETQEWNIGHLAVEPWISPTPAPTIRPSRSHFTIAALIALSAAGWR